MKNIKRMKPLLNRHHKIARLNWCYWAKANPLLYDKIVWSDEATKKLMTNMKKFVWIAKGQPATAAFINEPPGRRFTRQVWGHVLLKPGEERVGPLLHLEGIQDSVKYIERMGNVFQKNRGIYNGNIFQQDGASDHMSRATQAWLHTTLMPYGCNGQQKARIYHP